jgi:hypothetical protein
MAGGAQPWPIARVTRGPCVAVAPVCEAAAHRRPRNTEEDPMNRMALLGLTAAAFGCDPGGEPPAAAEVSHQELIVPGARVRDFSQPGGGTFSGGNLYLTFVGTDGQINLVHRPFGGDFSAPWQVTGETTMAGASLIELGGELHLVFFDGNRNFVSLRSSDGGHAWGGRRSFSVAGSGSRPFGEPALVVFGGQVQAYVAVGPTNQTDTEWRNKGRIKALVLNGADWVTALDWQAETRSPSAAPLGGNLVVAWPHRDLREFRTRKWTPTGGWGSISINPRGEQGHLFTARTSPASVVWLFREEVGEFNRIKVARSFDGTNFSFLQASDHTTDRRPFGLWADDVSAGSGVVSFAHVGLDGESNLNFTTETAPFGD